MSTVSKIGLGFIVFGIILMMHEHFIIIGSPIVEGRVMDMVAARTSQGKGSTSTFPVVKYKTLEGREVVFKPKVGSSQQGVKAGDQVRVAYDREEPVRARLLTFGYRFGFGYCVAVLGLVIIFIGYGFRHGNDWVRKTYLS